MSALDDLRTMLPAWTAWSGLALYVLLAAATAWFSARFGSVLMLNRWRQSAPEHWSPRNNVAAAVRSHNGGAVLGLMFGIGLLLASARLHLSAWDTSDRFMLGMGLGFFIAVSQSLRAAGELRGEPFGWREWLRSLGQDFLLLLYPLLLPMIAGAFIGPELGPFEPLAVLAVLGAVAVLFYGGADCLLRWIGWTRPADDSVRAAIDRLAESGGVKLRSVDEIITAAANAYAWPISRHAAVTSGLLKHATTEQVNAVLAHEIGHLTEPRWRWHLQFLLSLVGRAIPLASWRLMLESERPMLGLGLAVGVFLVTNFIMLKLARGSEVYADRYAAEHGPSPQVLGEALEMLARCNLMPLNLQRGVHPPTYARMLDLGLKPDYPCPDPPPRSVGVIAFFVYLLACGAVMVGAVIGSVIVNGMVQEASTDTRLKVWATVGGDEEDLRSISKACEQIPGQKVQALRISLAADELER